MLESFSCYVAWHKSRGCIHVMQGALWESMSDGYLGGQGDLVSGLIRGITGVTIWVIGVINLPTKSP